MSTNNNVNQTPNAATLLEFANLQIAAEALYRQENITETEPINSEHLTDGNKHSSKRRVGNSLPTWFDTHHVIFSGSLKSNISH